MKAQRPTVVVIGGGFSGMAAVAALRKADVDVLLIDQKIYNTFQPLLYQVATGGLNPGDILYSLRAFCAKFPNTRFRHAVVTGIDKPNNQIMVDGDDPINYDYLIIATGVAENYFGIPGVAEHGFNIYTRGAALHTHDQIFSLLEALASPLNRSKEINLVVVGGGPTGVEMAGTLAEMAHVAVPYAYPEIPQGRIHVYLVERVDELLTPFTPKLRGYAKKTLEKKGVKLLLGDSVRKVTATAIHLSNGGVLPTRLVIWAAGVAPREEVKQWDIPTGRGGRLVVGPDYRLEGSANVFAIGDVAVHSPEPLPQLAQPAIQQGTHVAQSIKALMDNKPTTAFRYRDKGIMATIGRSAAVVQTPRGITLTSFPAWIAWLGLHVMVLLSNRNRLSVVTNLAVRYLTYPSNVNLIVGETKRPKEFDTRHDDGS